MSLLADERTAIRVGAVALTAGLAAVVFVVAIAPRLSFGDVVRVRVLYRELAGLREGAPVRSAGAQIGHVEAISLAPAGSSPLLDGAPGAVVHLALDPAQLARSWRFGAYVISSRGALSARFLELHPPAADASWEPARDGLEVRGVDPPTLDRVLQRTWDNLRTTRRFLDEVRPQARALRLALAELRETWAELSPDRGQALRAAAELAALIDEAARTWDDVLGGRAGLAELTIQLARAAATRAAIVRSAGQLTAALAPLRADLDRVVAQVGATAPAGKVAALLADSRALATKLSALSQTSAAIWQRWQRREGSLGRLLADPEFPEDAKDLGKILKRQPWRIFGHPEDTR